MSFLSFTLKRLWGYPQAEVDAADNIVAHRRLIEKKRLLREAYARWYRECLPAYQQTTQLSGKMIEVGCGAGYLEEIIPGLIKTDVVPNPFAERVMDGMCFDFSDSSLRAIFAIGVLHHMTDPRKFLAEAQRCLQPGGRLVMVETNDSWVERILCKILGHYEFFDNSISEWVNGSAKRMSGANLALSWVIFVRDRKLFHERFPMLHINSTRYHTFLPHIISGGMAYRSFAPSQSAPLVNLSEVLLKPFMRRIGTCMTIDISKSALK